MQQEHNYPVPGVPTVPTVPVAPVKKRRGKTLSIIAFCIASFTTLATLISFSGPLNTSPDVYNADLYRFMLGIAMLAWVLNFLSPIFAIISFIVGRKPWVLSVIAIPLSIISGFMLTIVLVILATGGPH